jgi:hypothetical protein
MDALIGCSVTVGDGAMNAGGGDFGIFWLRYGGGERGIWQSRNFSMAARRLLRLPRQSCHCRDGQ